MVVQVVTVISVFLRQFSVSAFKYTYVLIHTIIDDERGGAVG